MNRLRRWSVVCSVLILVVGFAAAGGQPPTAPKPADEKWLLDRALTVSPQPEPTPALKYRLAPVATELKEGNAVPIYLRLIYEQSDETRKSWRETPQKWNDMPLDKVPLADANTFLNQAVSRQLQQFDYGARRKTADWNYTIEQPDPIGILLPDMQQMRGFAPMLVLQARVKIAEGDYLAAARSFETGFAFGRHVAEAPFLISSLVGIAIANQLADRIPEWIERPNSPNLYWSLTALPRPLIDIRRQMEFEQRVPEMQFPDLADLDRPRVAGEWDAALKRFRTEFKRIDVLIKSSNEGPKAEKEAPPATDPDEPAAKSPDLGAARRFVAVRSGKSAAEVAAMPPAQVLLLYIAGTYADLRDDMFKNTYLPFSQAHSRVPEMDARLRAAKGGEGVRLAQVFLPAIAKAMMAPNRLERRLAMLRTIEALRLHASAHGVQLPESLDQVAVAPVPLDPGTGKPFEYSRDGATATLASRIPGEPLEATGMRYRVTVRGK